MIINHNLMAMNTHRQLGINNTATSKSMEKLSSGFRINRAGDDAAGLAISEKMRGQIRGLKQAMRNAQDGISLIQTAEGALSETHAILQRMRELAVQAATDTNTMTDRKELQKEINQLLDEIDRIGNNTEFNTQKLLDGTYSAKKIHIGANEGQNMDITIGDMTTDVLGAAAGTGNGSETSGDSISAAGTGNGSETSSGISSLRVDNVDNATTGGVLTQSGANAAITIINRAIEQVSAERSKLGAIQNRLEHTIANLGTSAENLQAAESRIRDLDMAEEIMAFTKNSILQQAATAMLAQANQQPQTVLQLLR
ncbi:MAG: flagellin Hag [Syntrophomonadaceae bacterium]|nr:flagellin Hag [Syntrophomonadaceae bacterium]